MATAETLAEPAFVRRRADLAASAIGLAVYAGCAVVAASGRVPALEQDGFHLLNGLPEWLRWIAWPLQLLGILFVPLLFAVVAAILRLWRLCLALALLPALKYAVEYGVVKQTVDRARPYESVCAEDPTCAVFRDVPLHGASFVSGHAMIAGAMAVLVLPYLSRRWGVAVLLVAVGVAVARVYLGAHNVLDVVGGLAVGVVIGSVLNLAVGVPDRADAEAMDDGTGVGP